MGELYRKAQFQIAFLPNMLFKYISRKTQKISQTHAEEFAGALVEAIYRSYKQHELALKFQ